MKTKLIFLFFLCAHHQDNAMETPPVQAAFIPMLLEMLEKENTLEEFIHDEGIAAYDETATSLIKFFRTEKTIQPLHCTIFANLLRISERHNHQKSLQALRMLQVERPEIASNLPQS